MKLTRVHPSLARLGGAARRGGELLWLASAAFLVAVGLSGTAGLMGWAATWWLFIGTTMFAWMVAFTWQLAEGRGFAPVLPAGLIAGTALVIVVGLFDALGPAALGVIALLAVLHPRVCSIVVRLARRAERADRERRPSHPVVVARSARVPAPVPVPAYAGDEHFVVPDELTVDDLCQAWCSSYVALQRARTVRSRLSAVQMRALYLDDLERRLGEDFTRWLTSVPRAAQDPRSFLQPRELAKEIETLDGGSEPERPASA